MPNIHIGDRTYHCGADETLLDALLRQDVAIPHACRQGVCQSCMLRSLQDPPPAAAQHGLKDVLRHGGHFLACLCRPEQDMTLSLDGAAAGYTPAVLVARRQLNADILQLDVECRQPFAYHGGQFVNLQRLDGLTRSYSIANAAHAGNRLSFHVRKLPGGRFSGWLHDELAVGDSLGVSAALGHCHYLPGRPDRDLLLIGTGSGLAPLAGIIAEALHHGHAGRIQLFHGSRDAAGLYWQAEMRQLAAVHRNFHYTPCLSAADAPAGYARGRAHDVALAAVADLRGWAVYLCGHPDLVAAGRRRAYLQGASLNDIHADAFHTAQAA